MMYNYIIINIMTVLLTLTTAGIDSGPFDLYSNLDSFTVPFETGVSKATLQAGYTTLLVPDYTTTVRVRSTGVCINYVDIPLYTNYYPFNFTLGSDCASLCVTSKAKVFK
jgi:hypothetical protein